MDKLSILDLHLFLCNDIRLARIGILIPQYVRDGYFKRLVSHHTIITVDDSGNRYWRINGLPHRADGPAITCADGSVEWYLDGRRHCENGPAVILADGAKYWYIYGKLHRDDGPAIECDTYKKWCKGGIPHRTDGPALIYADGKTAWFIDGIYCAKK